MSTRAQKVKGFIRCRAIRFLSTANQFSIGKLLIQHTIAFLSVNQFVFQKALSVTEGSPSPLCLHVFSPWYSQSWAAASRLRDEWLRGTSVLTRLLWGCLIHSVVWRSDKGFSGALLCVLSLSTSSHCSFLLELLCTYTGRAFPLFSVSKCSAMVTRSLGGHTVMVAKPLGGPVSTWDVVLNFWSACVWGSGFFLFFAPVPCVFLSPAPMSRSLASVVTRVYLPLLVLFHFLLFCPACSWT